MSNTTFAKSVDAFVTAQNKGVSAFGLLSAFAYDTVKELTGDSEAVLKVLKNSVSEQEAAYKVEHVKMAEFPTAYRSAKSVIMGAVKAGVSLVDEDGKPKGKTQLEKETKDAKGDSKSELDKFRSTMSTAASIFAKMDTLSDVQASKLLVTELASMVLKAEAALIAAASSK